MNRRKYILPIAFLTVSAASLLYGGIGGFSPGQPEIPTIFTEPDDRLERVEFDSLLRQLVNEESNIIHDRQGSLRPFMEKLAALRSGESGVVNILHIGDSHIQAGFWDGRMRDNFARDFGSGGRGVILPHRLTGTNEPRDYYIRSTVSYEGFRTTANPLKEKLGFTGTGVLFTGGAPEVEIWHKGGFDAVTVHHHPDAPFLAPVPELMSDMQCTMADGECSTTYYLSRTVDTLRMEALYAPKNYTPLYYGFTLHGGSTGVMYHAVGANSAAFEHFERQTTIPDGGASDVLPDLIIISLGTNNCFGRNYRSGALRTIIERFFGSLADNYPGIPVIVTTPRESCNLSGGRRVPNPNIEDAARVLHETATKSGFAHWDLYNAAGGKGISEQWYKMKLSGRDRIHLTEGGYNLIGDMFYDAFVKYYNDYMSIPAATRARMNLMMPHDQPPSNPYTEFMRYTQSLAAGSMARFADMT